MLRDRSDGRMWIMSISDGLCACFTAQAGLEREILAACLRRTSSQYFAKFPLTLKYLKVIWHASTAWCLAGPSQTCCGFETAQKFCPISCTRSWSTRKASALSSLTRRVCPTPGCTRASLAIELAKTASKSASIYSVRSRSPSRELWPSLGH